MSSKPQTSSGVMELGAYVGDTLCAWKGHLVPLWLPLDTSLSETSCYQRAIQGSAEAHTCLPLANPPHPQNLLNPPPYPVAPLSGD